MSDEEQETAALQQALDRGSTDKVVPEDALQAAALIRYSAGGDTLDPAAEQRILGDVLRSVPQPKKKLWILAPLVAAAAAIVIVLQQPAKMPAPSIALLRAQASAAQRNQEAGAVLEREMRAYRREVHQWMASR